MLQIITGLGGGCPGHIFVNEIGTVPPLGLFLDICERKETNYKLNLVMKNHNSKCSYLGLFMTNFHLQNNY